MTIPAPIASGTKAGVSTWLNALREAVLGLSVSKPKGSVAFATQTTPSGTVQQLALPPSGITLYNVGGMVNAPASVIQVTRRGWHQAMVRVSFAANGTGTRTVQVRTDGGILMEYTLPAISGAGTTVTFLTRPSHYEAGTAFSVHVLQTSGTALQITGAELSVWWMDEAA